jgi:hypothetical protein
VWLTVSEGGALNVVDIGPTKTHKNSISFEHTFWGGDRGIGVCHGQTRYPVSATASSRS